MRHRRFVVVTDRGGHLANASRLLEQMALTPEAIVVSRGPETESWSGPWKLHAISHLFTWTRTSRRFVNPIGVVRNVGLSLIVLLRIRPEVVVSLGASATVPFCYIAWALGARVVMVECMNQVDAPSRTARILGPICSEIFVQWEDLVERSGPKARYEGWVL